MRPLFIGVLYCFLSLSVLAEPLSDSAYTGNSERLHVLESLSKHPDHRVRKALVEATEEAWANDPFLLSLVTEVAEGGRGSWSAQRTAARTLLKLQGEEYLPRLEEMLTGTNRIKQAAACRIIEDFGYVAEPLTSHLIPFLGEKDGLVREPAASALVALLPASVDELLVHFEGRAISILGLMIQDPYRDFAPDLFKDRILPRFLEEWRAKGSEVRYSIPLSLYHALEVYGSIPELEELQPLLMSSLADKSRGESFICVHRRGGIPPSLRPMLKNGIADPAARGWCSIGLDALNSTADSPAERQSAIPELIQTLEEEKFGKATSLIIQTLLALAKHGPVAEDATSVIGHYLSSGGPNNSKRRAAAVALGAIATSPEALRMLQSELNSGSVGKYHVDDFERAIKRLSGRMETASGSGPVQLNK